MRQLQPWTTAATPDDMWNGTATLDAWLQAFEPDINPGLVHDLEGTFFAGAGVNATAPVPGGPGWFDSSFTIAPDTAHLFSFNTCNGCHTFETQTPFVHIAPRPAGVPAALSAFLSQTNAPGGGGLPASWMTIGVPAGIVVEYNEPWRRTCEVARLMSGSSTPISNAAGF